MFISVLAIAIVVFFWILIAYLCVQLTKDDYKILPGSIEDCLVEIDDITLGYAFHDRVRELTEQIRKLQEK